MVEFLKSMLMDERNSISSKRVSGLLCIIALVIALLANTFSKGAFTPSEGLVDAISLFAFGSLGLTTIDKFTKKEK
jgi:hypothetical protein